MNSDHAGVIPSEVEEWIERYITFRLTRCHPRLLEWQGLEKTGANLENSLRGERRWLGDESVLKGYSKGCPVEGASPEEYGIRLLQFDGIGTLLAGIHFYGCDLDRPFIHVSAMDFELDSCGEGELRRLLWNEFGVFRPRWFRIWIDSDDSPLADLAGAWFDGYFLAGQLGAIQASARPSQSERISLVAEPGLDSFAEYEECYREFHKLHPGTEAWLEVSDRDAIETCAKAGANFRVRVDDEPGGWMAGKLDDSGPLSGWQVVEESLETRFRGQGLAAAMQRAFLDTLPGEDLVWGTIDTRNAASLRTARRVGREIVCGYLFLPFA